VNYQCTFTPNGEEFNIQANSSTEAFIKCAKEVGSIEWTMVSIREVSTFWQGDTQEYFKSQLEKFGDGEKAVDFNARSDGSVGWYEILGESVISDRGILLAQLHELRTIKRCVVCIIIIVIVIPLIVGAIISG